MSSQSSEDEDNKKELIDTIITVICNKQYLSSIANLYIISIDLKVFESKEVKESLEEYLHQMTVAELNLLALEAKTIIKEIDK